MLNRRTCCGTLGLGLLRPAAFAAEPLRNIPTVGASLRLPDVTLINGGEFKAADAEGRVTVVYWWASWCPFCAQVTPHVQKLWRAQKDRGLTVLGLSIDKDAATAKAYLDKRGYDFPSGWNNPAVEAVLPKPQGLPVTVVRGRNGRVVWAEAGQLFPEDVEQLARFL